MARKSKKKNLSPGGLSELRSQSLKRPRGPLRK